MPLYKREGALALGQRQRPEAMQAEGNGRSDQVQAAQAGQRGDEGEVDACSDGEAEDIGAELLGRKLAAEW